MLSPLLLAILAAELHSAHPVYESVAPAVVGITCTRGAQERYFGTGTIIDETGLVITSITVVPKDASRIRVYLKGGEVLKGRGVLTDAEKELSLFRIVAPDENRKFAHVKLGDSNDVRVGEQAFTLGNAFLSIEADDQVSFGEGVVSGLYIVMETLSESKYKGRAIETTAHLNSGMDGGPLVNKDGALIGILCLNYSKSRWLGTAVPIDELKPLMGDEIGWLSDRTEPSSVYTGLEVQVEKLSQLRIRRVHLDSPASQSGLNAGDRIVAVNGMPVKSLKELRAAFQSSAPGKVMRIEALRGQEALQAEFKPWGKL